MSSIVAWLPIVHKIAAKQLYIARFIFRKVALLPMYRRCDSSLSLSETEMKLFLGFIDCSLLSC